MPTLREHLTITKHCPNAALVQRYDKCPKCGGGMHLDYDMLGQGPDWHCADCNSRLLRREHE